MIFSNNQISELFKTIETYHVLFIATNVGKEVLTKEDIELLKNSGVNLDTLPKETIVNHAFKFGVLAEALGDEKTKNMSFDDFNKYIKKGNFIPLTKIEEKTLERVKHQAYHDIKGLGNRISKDLTQIHIEADTIKRQKYEKLIEQTADETIANRESVKDMAIKLGEKTQDWSRDFGRIADYIMHSSYEEGRAGTLEDDYGADVLVYKEVFEGACRHCIRLYTTGGVGSEPRIFKLSRLKANGTNIGRKVAEWLATISGIHPFCRCTLKMKPEGGIWNPKKFAFDLPKEWIRKVNRTSKIKITIGNQQFEI